MRTVVVVLLALAVQPAGALELSEAERLAIEADPTLQALAARGDARVLDAVADAQLPDPKLQLGAQSVPLPDFDIIDEPMTQLQLGIEQRVPARSLREARARRATADAEGLALEARARALKVRAEVRTAWVTTVRLQDLIELTEQRAALLQRYSEALDDGLQSGRVSQQTLLEGRSRAIRVQRELAGLRTRLAEQRARLGERVPGVVLPAPLSPASLPEIVATDLDDHPEVRAAAADLLGTEAEIAAAEAAFDPGWSWSVGVGRRVGDTPLGAPSDTLLNARLAIDLPLFTERRQSKRLEAARARHRAAATGPVQVRRALEARRAGARDAAGAFGELVTLYGEQVLPASQAAADAARDKYRNGSIPLEDVLAAELEVLDVEHERTEAQLDHDLARVELAYLGGR
ncbi:TolC family protein [Wenzhouxiangella sp. XN79A]|uniref:TolC family protein n=1 Tax=Wenzhouxiangella sp. XN79A TaxID=2724193 RepID=UPI00144AEE02|nr:TolC family protein [Wenzhouxiangella sp. XN79A]NKI36188.1 TolC family protein [Wenzhouxiangella sp. XN79A]